MSLFLHNVFCDRELCKGTEIIEMLGLSNTAWYAAICKFLLVWVVMEAPLLDHLPGDEAEFVSFCSSLQCITWAPVLFWIST